MKQQILTFKEFFELERQKELSLNFKDFKYGIALTGLTGLFDVNLWSGIEQMQGTMDNISGSISSIGEFCNYLIHPSKILFLVWQGAVGISYWATLVVGLFAIICYIFNFKKYVKWLPFSIFIYIFIQCLNIEMGL